MLTPVDDEIACVKASQKTDPDGGCVMQ